MNEKLIKAIKEINGVKTVSTVSEQLPNSDNTVIVTFEPEPPVLHDEYGVPLFEGDKYWWARDHNFQNYKAYEIYCGDNCTVDLLTPDLPKDTHIFASKESAERWIKENKPRPIYVDDEGVEFFEGDEVYYFSKSTCLISSEYMHIILSYDTNIAKGTIEYSKIFKTKKECEIALANFILSKYE